ncbi:MAG: type II toxin-antitoxin system VapC family toxin [Actinobacteria bacterium]|nr:type II toxin-antitoxin system VapC family toxin [Actinomycetota bacterium]
MILSYVDTSAAMKLVFEEPDSDAAAGYFMDRSGRTLIASWLLHTELHCAAGRRTGSRASALGKVLGMIDLVEMIRGDFIAAGALAPLRAQDALHLAVAMRLGADEIVTYDHELGAAAERAGLRVVSPGSTLPESPALP